MAHKPGDETIRSHGGPKADPLLGTVVENYRFESVVGTGSMGIVYRAMHTLIAKPAAIKVLKRDYADDPEMVQRLVREARTVNAIRHPAIVNAFGFGTLPRTGQPYIVMDLLVGEPLDTFIKREAPVSLRVASGIIDELLSGLYAAHQVGVVHRDMKPGNCFLERQPDGSTKLKLLDFGLARQADRVGGSIRPTNPGTLIGTPAFMAPEQVMGSKVTPATDVYAVGGIAYQLLTGHLPHEASTAIDVLTLKMKQDPTPPKHWNPRLEDDVEAWILSLLARDPEQRPRDADAVRRAFRRLCESRTLAGAPAHPTHSAPASHAALPHITKRPPTQRRECGDAQTILVESGVSTPSESSTDSHKSPWAKTVAISPPADGGFSSTSTPTPELTPPMTGSVKGSVRGPPAVELMPPTEIDRPMELLPPTLPAGAPGVGPMVRGGGGSRATVRTAEPSTSVVNTDDEDFVRRPVALWVALGVLGAVIIGVGLWLIAH